MNPANALSQLSPGMAECHARLMAVAKHGTPEAFSATLAGVLQRAELSISNAYDAGAKSIQVEAVAAPAAANEITKAFREYLTVHPSIKLGGHEADTVARELALIAQPDAQPFSDDADDEWRKSEIDAAIKVNAPPCIEAVINPDVAATALRAYIKDCEAHAIVPDVGGAWHAAFLAGAASRTQPPAGVSSAADERTRDLKNAIDTATELRQQLRLMEESARGEIWRWQADGVDNLATMGNRMGVLIYASDLRDLIASASTTAQGAPTATFQQRVHPWLLECFGAEIAADRVERYHRFLEESLELVQSLGCTASEAHQLVGYVFGRPVGEPAQEVGGVMVTLAALCLANGLDMHDAGEVELTRISVPELVAKIRAKQAAKPKHSPLPGAVAKLPEELKGAMLEDAARDFPDLTPELSSILGTVCFQCIPFAQALRAAGHQIKTRAEDEQAAVLHWMLGHYFRHGEDGWRKAAAEEMGRMQDAALAQKEGNNHGN